MDGFCQDSGRPGSVGLAAGAQVHIQELAVTKLAREARAATRPLPDPACWAFNIPTRNRHAIMGSLDIATILHRQTGVAHLTQLLDAMTQNGNIVQPL